jgi:choline kinase
MIGLVLAAGPGRRLAPLTDELPKTLLPVAGERTILDAALANLAGAGLDEVVIVTGFAAEQIERRLPELERRHDLRLATVFNERAAEWNNAYSLWLARDWFPRGMLLINGDTLHPPAVEARLLAARGPEILLAVDDVKPLGQEEMKVLTGDDGTMRRITKTLDPAAAAGEYIGVSLIEPDAAEPLAKALEATFSADPSRYYEDGYQCYADSGGSIAATSIGHADWVEVDTHADLARAREIACRS